MPTKYQQFVIYGYKIPVSKYKSTLRGSTFQNQYAPINRDISEDDVILLADVRNGEYCLLGSIQYMTERSDLIDEINPPYRVDEPTEEQKHNLENAVEQSPLDLSTQEPSVFIITHEG